MASENNLYSRADSPDVHDISSMSDSDGESAGGPMHSLFQQLSEDLKQAQVHETALSEATRNFQRRQGKTIETQKEQIGRMKQELSEQRRLIEKLRRTDKIRKKQLQSSLEANFEAEKKGVEMGLLLFQQKFFRTPLGRDFQFGLHENLLQAYLNSKSYFERVSELCYCYLEYGFTTAMEEAENQGFDGEFSRVDEVWKGATDYIEWEGNDWEPEDYAWWEAPLQDSFSQLALLDIPASHLFEVGENSGSNQQAEGNVSISEPAAPTSDVPDDPSLPFV